MKIRMSNKSDYKEITRIYYRLFGKKFGIVKVPNFKSENLIVVAQKENQIIGFCWAIFFQYALYRLAIVVELYVKKNYRNATIEKSLLKTMLNKLKNKGVIAIFRPVSKKDKVAQKVNLQLGFKRSLSEWYSWHTKVR